MAFIAQLHGLSYLRLFSKWQKSKYRTPAAFVIKRQNIIKKSHENTHKTSSKKTWKQALYFMDADLCEVTIKYFIACRDSLQVAAICAVETQDCMTKQTKEILALRLSSESSPWTQQCSIVLLFSLVKVLEVGIKLCRVAQPSFSPPCTNKDLQGSGLESQKLLMEDPSKTAPWWRLGSMFNFEN